MKEQNEKITFIFSNRSDSLASTLSAILACFHKLTNDDNELLQWKVKWSVTELLTNAVKHAGTENTVFYLYENDKCLIIEKTDNGKPFSLFSLDNDVKLTWPLKEEYVQQKFVLQNNGSESLTLVINSQSHATFSFNENTHSNPTDSLEHFSEHFGLLIITKSSDRFEYEYDAQTKTNLFRCTFYFD